MRRLAFCLLPLLGGAAELRAAVVLEMATDPAGDTLVVSGASPGGQVALIGVGREERDNVVTAVQGCELLAAGPDGVASWPLGRRAPDFSRWLAIDLASGGSGRLDLPVVVSFSAPAATFPPVVLTRSAATFRLVQPGSAAVLVARPGAGAWCANTSDGGQHDTDLAEDGGADVAVEDLAAAAGTSGLLSSLAAGDWLVFGDSDSVELWQIQVNPTHLANNRIEP